MDNRREALLKILSATGVESRLTELQCRELLDHLEDSVEHHISQGLSEGEALVHSFEAMGNLDEVAKEFPAIPPLALAADGVLPLPGKIKVMSRASLMALGCFFGVVMIVGIFADFLKDMSSEGQLPFLTRFFLTLSARMTPLFWLMTVMLTGGAAAWLAHFPLTQKNGRKILWRVGLAGFLVLCLAIWAIIFPIFEATVGSARLG